MANTLLISPHSDDATLFMAYTCMREKPLVLTVTDSYVQQNRGENITPNQRRIEDIEAMKVLGCPIVFGGIRDDIIDTWAVEELFYNFQGFDKIYAPAPIFPNGNIHHNLIGETAIKIFGDKVVQYMTYSKEQLYMPGSIEIIAKEGEELLKELALQCYKSQINLPATKPHFEAVRGMSEWMI